MLWGGPVVEEGDSLGCRVCCLLWVAQKDYTPTSEGMSSPSPGDPAVSISCVSWRLWGIYFSFSCTSWRLRGIGLSCIASNLPQVAAFITPLLFALPGTGDAHVWMYACVSPGCCLWPQNPASPKGDIVKGGWFSNTRGGCCGPTWAAPLRLLHGYRWLCLGLLPAGSGMCVCLLSVSLSLFLFLSCPAAWR